MQLIDLILDAGQLLLMPGPQQLLIEQQGIEVLPPEMGGVGHGGSKVPVLQLFAILPRLLDPGQVDRRLPGRSFGRVEGCVTPDVRQLDITGPVLAAQEDRHLQLPVGGVYPGLDALGHISVEFQRRDAPVLAAAMAVGGAAQALAHKVGKGGAAPFLGNPGTLVRAAGAQDDQVGNRFDAVRHFAVLEGAGEVIVQHPQRPVGRNLRRVQEQHLLFCRQAFETLEDLGHV